MVHLYNIDLYNNAEYYTIGIEGDKDKAENYLKTISHDVRYINTRENGKKDTGDRTINEDIKIVFCEFKYQVRTIKDKKTCINTLPTEGVI